MYGRNSSVGTDRFLRLSLVVYGEPRFYRNRWNWRYETKEILSTSLEAVPLNFSNQTTQQKLLEMVTATGVDEL